MKTFLSFIVLITLSAPAFSQLTFTLSKYPDTIPHQGYYHIEAVTDNRHFNQNQNVVGRLYGIVGSQKNILKRNPVKAFYNFYNSIHPKQPADTAAILIRIDSVLSTNIKKGMGVTFITTLSLAFVQQSTGRVLCSFIGSEEGKTGLLYARLYRDQTEALLLRALRHFETVTLTSTRYSSFQERK